MPGNVLIMISDVVSEWLKGKMTKGIKDASMPDSSDSGNSTSTWHQRDPCGYPSCEEREHW